MPLFPLVGAAVGALGGLAAVLLEPPLPPLAAAGVALAIRARPGALHVDALADTPDALGAGRARARSRSCATHGSAASVPPRSRSP